MKLDFYSLANSISTDNHLLFSLTDFISIETTLRMFFSKGIAYHKEINVDLPIEELFDEHFKDYHFILISGRFELHHGFNIPDEFLDYKKTLREFVNLVSQLPKSTPSEFKEHLEEFKLA